MQFQHRATPYPALATTVVDAAGLSDCGKVRTRNEDHFLISTLGATRDPLLSSLPGASGSGWTEPHGTALLVVADGVGGQGDGGTASSLAVRTVAHQLRDPAGLQDPRQALASAFHIADQRVVAAARHDAELSDTMATTLTAALVIGSHLVVAHAGDSRAYLLRHGEMRQLTRDHTFAAELAERGMAAPPEWKHLLSNCIGGGRAAARPELGALELRPDDTLVLCSDGLTGHVSDGEIADCVLESSSAREACEHLVRSANAGGGRDNITVVVATVR